MTLAAKCCLQLKDGCAEMLLWTLLFWHELRLPASNKAAFTAALYMGITLAYDVQLVTLEEVICMVTASSSGCKMPSTSSVRSYVLQLVAQTQGRIPRIWWGAAESPPSIAAQHLLAMVASFADSDLDGLSSQERSRHALLAVQAWHDWQSISTAVVNAEEEHAPSTIILWCLARTYKELADPVHKLVSRN